MAGISNKWIWALAALSVVFSCVKEKALEEPVNPEDERFAEFDPVVRFGLDTYMGGADDNEPLTKTTYAGEDQYEIIFDKAAGKNVRYERINWNVWKESPDPMDLVNKPDTVRILAEEVFTKNKKKTADYSPWEIPGLTNRTGLIKDSAADAMEVGTGGNAATDNDKFYWELSQKPRYFYAVYPSPADRPGTYQPRVSVDEDDIDVSTHTISVSGSIPRYQKYLDTKVTGNVVEYLPDMSNAYMYAAAKIPSADAGYVKVPLRFKPLFSAVKLKVTAADAGAQNYRLKKVELRTDLFYDDLHQSDPKRVNQPKYGTPLNGDFTAEFGTVPSGDDKKPEYTGDFTVTDYTGKDPVARDTTNKRLTIRIEETDRVWLEGGKEVNVTFLALPIQQEVMTIVYTFEVNDGFGNPKTDDKGNIIEVTRYLALQQKTTKADNTGEHNEFRNRGWFPLPKATKLYVKSNVPEIQYFFDVVAQGNFPRTWRGGSVPIPSGEFLAKDFYAVISYRDSADVLQPLRWKVTKYKPEGGSWQDAPPSWLRLRGDDPWTKLAPFDVDDSEHPGHKPGGEWGSFDPWDVPQGQGTSMKDKRYDPKTGSLIGYGSFNKYSFTYYDAAALNNDDSYARGWDWDNHASYSYKDPEGFYTFRESHTPISSAWTGDADEAIAFDLSSHDIYGVLYSGLKNGDLGTTANCYVVSAPGWYRFPAVYGNAIKGGVDNHGVDNPKAYNRGVPHTTDGIMGAYLDHMDQKIKDPWIPYDIKSVSVVWEDATSLVSERKDDATRMDRRPFCETIDGKKYIYFYVDDIAQGNAVVAAKDDEGKIVWSWHIWAVTKPVEYLATIELESNETVLDPYNPLDGISRNTVMPNSYNFSAYPSTSPPLQFPFAKKSSVKNVFWKTANLGQNDRESEKAPRYCDVEFTQYFKGKVVAKLVRRFFQSGVYDYNSLTPVYQWGRKDPLPNPANPVQLTEAEIGNQYTGRTIQHPTDYYYGPATIPITGVRYDNLWNNNITTAVTDSRCNNPLLAPSETLQFPGGSQDRNVAKTIYDPSPAGYVMPNMYAFSGLNPYGTIEQTRFPAQKIDSIAYNATATYKTDGTGYIDFYAHYDPSTSVRYKRKKDPSKTIRIFVSGRLNGTNADGVRTQENLIYLWTSEPGIWNGYYGRSLCSQNTLPTSGSWNFNPVTGVSRQELSDPSDPTSPLTPNITTQGAQAKWQRSHGEPVRPMVEQP